MRSAATKISLLLAAGLAALLPLPSARAADVVNQPMPSLAGVRLDGAVPDLKGKVVLVDFWASWCAPCKASFPAMAELHQRFAGRGLVILAISVDQDGKAYARFLDKNHPPFATVRDLDQKLVAAFGAQTMPTSFLVDRQGVVRFRHDGFHGAATAEAYAQQIEKLLSENAP